MKRIFLLFVITALLTACASYTINGQKVSKAQKGLYIINGKKQVLK